MGKHLDRSDAAISRIVRGRPVVYASTIDVICTPYDESGFGQFCATGNIADTQTGNIADTLDERFIVRYVPMFQADSRRFAFVSGIRTVRLSDNRRNVP
ncbi:MAG TPA: hypothetical protein VGD80_01465, partial [Kofleriaceae bacterium]